MRNLLEKAGARQALRISSALLSSGNGRLDEAMVRPLLPDDLLLDESQSTQHGSGHGLYI